MTPPDGWALVTESGRAGVALGPVVAPACLDCVRERRLAGAVPPGSFSLRPLSGAAWQALRGTPLLTHQVHPADGAQRFVAPAACGERCRPPGPLPLEDCIGSRLGLVRRVDLVQARPGSFTAIALGARSIGSAGAAAVCSGTATAGDPALARRLALYEALERYAAAYWRGEDLLDRGDPAGPRVAMRVLTSGREVAVEAARVFMPFRDNRGRWGGSSEGLACGASAADALERAVAELIERRALAAWLARIPRDGVPPASTGACSAVVARAGTYAVAASVTWSTMPPYGALGFGCARSAQAAIDKAQRERMHVAAHQWLARQGYWEQPQTPASPLDDMLMRMADDPVSAHAFAAAVCAPLAPASIPVPTMAWRDVTPPDVGAFGLRVVRALAL